RISYERFAMTSDIASGQPRLIAFSTIREDTSSIGSPQVHVPKADRGAAHACVERLTRVGLAAEARLEVEVLADRVDRGPEGGRRQLDDRVPNGVLDLCVLDGRIVDDVHDLGPDPHADAVRRNERLARLARLPAEDAVRFGRVAARLVGGDARNLRSGDQVHLALRGLLALDQGALHRTGFIDHPLSEVPSGDSFPASGPPVVPVRLFDLPVLRDREEIEHPKSRAV